MRSSNLLGASLDLVILCIGGMGVSWRRRISVIIPIVEGASSGKTSGAFTGVPDHLLGLQALGLRISGLGA